MRTLIWANAYAFLSGRAVSTRGRTECTISRSTATAGHPGGGVQLTQALWQTLIVAGVHVIRIPELATIG